jgi:hypothetical protein
MTTTARVAIVIACAPALAFADVTPNPNVTVDAPVHETPVEKPTDDNTDRAEEANLDPRQSRRGFFLHAGLGPSITIGGGTGSGAGATLAFGAVMSPHFVMVLAMTANGQGHEVMDQLHINDYTSIGLGLEWWPRNGAVHIRGTTGFGGYRCKQCADPEEPTDPVKIDYERRGLNLTVAVGVDIVRFKGLVWGLEIGGVGTVHRLATSDGVIVSLGLQSYLSLD